MQILDAAFSSCLQVPTTPARLKRTLSDKRRMSFNVAMHYPVITVYYAAISKH